ncbi:YHS domain-containing (seleno)protein [cf. Phormidesmis sp. LEGE 11477]|uniref:YHS domain-containing (seleno)protein n=1 Tax=cf. Phormidesmis sp. LEGE 11477 TaxID=1828680 RepID=UPI001882600F|nr:YHS domain-containing (seleno)protein [cf. Phormidesmis sp. LEGE 11477]MBE9063493.1 YHS domain-containing protein [cf. Phormidesmis sp. LEGE 11477]
MIIPCTRRPLFSTLVVSTLALTISLSACAPSTTESSQSASSQSASSQSAQPVSSTSSTADTAEPKVYTQEGIAIKGADPVAYFTESAFVEGSADYTHEWQGVTWQFASAENRDLFADDPEAYAPEYGGYCAWAVGQKALVAVDPAAWEIVDGKLYLNANQKVQTRWAKDIPGNIALADTHWPELSAQ